MKKSDCLKSFDTRITGKANGWIFAKIVYDSGGVHQDNVFAETHEFGEWVFEHGEPNKLYVILIDTDLTSQFTELRETFLGCVLVVNHWELQCLLMYELERIKKLFEQTNITIYKKGSIITEQFGAQVQQQKLDAIKRRELQDGVIYTIVNAELIDTQYGEACILTLSNETKVFAPSALVNRLKRESYNKPFPRYVRPKGRVKSKKNPAQTYYAFDLV